MGWREGEAMHMATMASDERESASINTCINACASTSVRRRWLGASEGKGEMRGEKRAR